MIKHFLVYVLCTAMTLGLPVLGEAAKPKKEEKPKAKAGVDAAAEARKKAIDAKKGELNGTQWEVTVKSATDKDAKEQGDSLIFQNGQFRSAAQEKRGFSATNYTLSIQEGNNPTVWETMQSSDQQGTVFWRGEWNGNNMSGLISKQLGQGKTEDLYFVSKSMKKISPTSEPEKKEEPAKEAPKPTPAAAAKAPAAAASSTNKAAVPASPTAAKNASAQSPVSSASSAQK